MEDILKWAGNEIEIITFQKGKVIFKTIHGCFFELEGYELNKYDNDSIEDFLYDQPIVEISRSVRRYNTTDTEFFIFTTDKTQLQFVRRTDND